MIDQESSMPQKPTAKPSQGGSPSKPRRKRQKREHSEHGTEAFRPDAVQPLSYSEDPEALSIDRLVRAGMARATAGISPVSVALAWLDWASNFALSPGKQADLMRHAAQEAAQFTQELLRQASGGSFEAPIHPQIGDKRFSSEAWRKPPFNLYQQAFLQGQRWWHNVFTGVAGVSKHHEQIVSFIARQMLDVLSPSNFLATNPELMEATQREGGANLVRGLENWWRDAQANMMDPEGRKQLDYLPGRDVALTPGRVIYRNRLIELIQYEPQSEQVYAEPVLIVPAWIMKYYILDLSPDNSLIGYLVRQGHTVFAISWRNPDANDSDLGMEDYRKLGPMAALDAIAKVLPGRKVHALGYCLGGTLMAIAAAAMGRDGDDRLQSLTLLAAQVDFSDAGELMLFIDPSEIAYLEDMMWSQGYLDTKQMAGAFTMLRSNDLFWSRLLHEYFFGQRTDQNDLMSWNADATRMPYRMHSEYLRNLFLENRLSEGNLQVDGSAVALTDIQVPILAVGTVKDHVAPWRSVYKIHLFTDTPVTFLLTSGGHNAGIVTPPGHPRRIYQITHVRDHERFMDPERWREITPVHKGSWWPDFESWLSGHSGPLVDPPAMGCPEQGFAPLEAAPGLYVMER
ncbi:MAG: alpha/beta fold hydrolase [Limibacillus sp.]